MIQKISIIVPIYNTEVYLKRCIESILKQTYKNIEILLIDNNSDDNSIKICKNYAKKDKRIIVLNEKKQGVSCVRNLGLKKATGDFITFVDGDDFLDKKAIETMLSLMNKYNVDVVRTFYKSESKTHEISRKNIVYNKTYTTNKIQNKLIKQLLSQDLGGYLWILLIRSDIAKKIKFNEKLYVHQDLDYYLKLFLNIKSIYISNLITYNYCHNPNNSTSKKYYKRNLYSIIDLNNSLKESLNNKYSVNLNKLINTETIKMIVGYFKNMYLNDNENFKNITRELKKNKKFKDIYSNSKFKLKSFLTIKFSNNNHLFKLLINLDSFIRKIKK